ncbi:MAG TPA: hypothetical protein VN673_10420 [Clostridia bacterium]|nr:hypothetical protein [Clostridia bacterium]
MKIHGLRIYPQSVEVVRGDGAPIFVHGHVSEDCSDFFYTFRPMASVWRGHLFAETFGVSYDEKMKLEDPMPGLREQFGPNLIATDLDTQLMLLQGDDFVRWGASMYFCEGAFLPIFRTRPTFDLLKRLYWSRDFRLTSDTWPTGMRAVLHMWDDIYWQIFTTERTDLDILIRAHTGDPRLKMYSVDFDREYPDPSNQELQIAALSDETSDT